MWSHYSKYTAEKDMGIFGLFVLWESVGVGQIFYFFTFFWVQFPIPCRWLHKLSIYIWICIYTDYSKYALGLSQTRIADPPPLSHSETKTSRAAIVCACGES